MLEQEGRGDSCPGGHAAGRTAGLEICLPDILGLGQGKTLPGALKKVPGNILAPFADHPGPARQDIIAVAAGQIRCRTRCGQAAKLLRADREPVPARQRLQAGGGWPEFPVIAGAQPGQAGTDENNFMLCV